MILFGARGRAEVRVALIRLHVMIVVNAGDPEEALGFMSEPDLHAGLMVVEVLAISEKQRILHRSLLLHAIAGQHGESRKTQVRVELGADSPYRCVETHLARGQVGKRRLW